jgi:excisionase family DNA binding protein
VTAPADEVLSPNEVATYLKVHKQTVYQHIRDGELKAVKRGNRIYIRRCWLDEFLAPTSDVA